MSQQSPVPGLPGRRARRMGEETASEAGLASSGSSRARRTLAAGPVRFGADDEPTGERSEDTTSPEAAANSSRRARRREAKLAEPAKGKGRAGRDLPAAIGVGVGLATLVIASLVFRKELFVALVCAAVVLAIWELVDVLGGRKIHAPVIPMAVGSVGMLVSAYVAGSAGLMLAFATTCFGVLLWRLVDGPDGALRDTMAGVFITAYVPFLAGFAMLMVAEADGPQRVAVFVATVVASDVGGYAAGVLFGKHPMAPSVSPKKSWEGFAGSVTVSMLAASALIVILLDGPWWAGLIVGAATAATATGGDLSESLLKRDLGVKDMGSLLPGHGGIMDRLDSLLITAPVAALLLSALVGAGS